MLHVDGVNLKTDTELIFENVNLHVARGEICCINTGIRDGSTRLLKCMAGILEPTSGCCRIDGIRLSEFPDNSLLQLACFCYEDGGLISLFNVYENIVLPLVYHQNVNPHTLYEQVQGITQSLFIADCLNKRVHELNDVQTRLVNLARALLVGAKFLLLDEIQEGMSPKMRDAVLTYLLSEQSERNLSIIMTTTAGDDTTFAGRIFSIANKQLQEH